MPNAIKYSTTGDTLSLKKGNIFFGVGDVGKGPSSATTYYNGVTPSASGYTIYSYNASQTSKLSFHTAVDDAALRDYTNRVSGESFASAAQCLNWYATQTNYVCVNRDYEGIITNGLVLNLDAGFTPSYSTSGVTWYDLGYSGFNGTLTNGPTYSGDSGGAIVFDGSDDYVVRNASINTGQDFSVFAWIKPGAINVRNGIVGNSYPYSLGSGWFFSTATNYGGTLNTFFISVGSDNAYRTATNNSLTLNTWNYIGGTVTNGGQDIKLYSNGIETGYFGGTLTANTVNYTTQEFYVGRRHSASPEPFNGSISIVQIYNRVLSATEILQNYNAQKSRYVASFDADAQAFITAAGITDPTQQNAINQLTLDLKSYNIWSSMNAIYPFVGGTATTHKYNLKDPRDLNAAYRLTFGGGWVHNNNGATGNGVNTYADTNYNGFQSGELGVYNRGGGAVFGGVYDEWEGGDYPIYGVPWISSYTLTNAGSSWFSDNVDQSNVLNHYGVNLNLGLIGLFGGTGTVKYYKNGALNSSLSSLPNASSLSIPLWLGGINNNGRYGSPFYGNSQLAFGFISTTQFNDTQNANLYTAVQAFQTTLGRQV